MKKIKVLMLGWEYPPYVTGGLGTHCGYLTKAFANLPVKIYFITPHPIHKKRGNLEVIGLDISQKFKEGGKIISYGKCFKKKARLYKKKAVETAQKLDFDVIHCQDWMPIETSIIVKKISKKPLIITIHSTEFDKRKHPRKKKIKLEKKGMVFADRIIAVSHHTKEMIIKYYGIPQKKIIVIPNAVKQKKIPVIKYVGKTKYILSLGRITYQKGIPYLIDAAEKVVKKDKNVKFLIGGKGSEKYKDKLKIKVKKLHLEKHILFIGYVKNEDYYYKKAYLFVMPSVSEPFGITPLEAITNGTPVLISKQSGVSEVLKSGVKFNYWDSNYLAKKILFLVRNKKAYDKLRKNSIKEIKNFSWEGVAKKTLKFYQRTI